MQSSKLLTLISGLDTSEFRWLHKFLKSPFYNTNEKVLRLFEYIKKYYPDLASPKLAKEITFQYLFPKEKFSPQKMRKLMHELATLVEDFMVAQHFQKHKFARKKILTKELGQRNLYGLFEKNSEELTSDLDKLPYRDKDYFLEQYQNAYQLFAHPSTNPQQDFIPKLFQMSDKLDQFYFLQKMQLNSVLESAKHIYQVKETLPFYEPIAQEIKNRELEKTSVFHLYSLVIQLFQTQDTEEIFNQLYDAFFDKKDNLGEKDKTFILKYLINFVLGKTNEGNEEYVEKGLTLYKVGLTDNLLITKNRMTERTFINIAWSSSFLRDFEFTLDFIKNYKQFLNEERREEIVILTKANLYFNLEDYNYVIELLSINSFSIIVDKLRCKLLLLKSYFELYLQDESYHNFTVTQIENFERNIRREEKISSTKKLGYLNFSKFFKKLIDFKTQKISLSKFEYDLEKTATISNRPWIKNKANWIARIQNEFVGET